MMAAMTAVASAGEPSVPHKDNEVLETLPTEVFARREDMTQLREQLAADPANPELAASVASRYMKLGSRTGDARYYGYARSALSHWWHADEPPAEILKLRAKLKEKNHEYDLALADLHRLLVRVPDDVQAWIETANILRVQGNYDRARKACDNLSAFAGPFATAIARIPIQAATGQAEEAYRELAKLLPEARAQYPSTVQWFVTMQAETAQALGRDDLADAHWREALQLSPDDKYALRAYAEFMLDHDRASESLALAAGRLNDDGLLLSAALAAKRLGREEDAARLRAHLAARFQEIRQRGDLPLGRFEARFTLLVENDPRRALDLAMANWRLQKEVHDTRTVLEAAIAAHDASAASMVLRFITENGVKHAGLDPLLKDIGREQ